MNELLRHLDKILAGLTALAAVGELAHVFSNEWVVFILALATFISEFFKPQAQPTLQQPQQVPPTKGGK
jgi:hypothetical protein